VPRAYWPKERIINPCARVEDQLGEVRWAPGFQLSAEDLAVIEECLRPRAIGAFEGDVGWELEALPFNLTGFPEPGEPTRKCLANPSAVALL
jgi:hypothetical protein